MASVSDSVNAASPPLVYTQNNAPAPSSKGFSDWVEPQNCYIDNGKLTIIDPETGEVFTQEPKDSRAERWALKSAVNKLLPRSRTSKCHRWRIPNAKPSVYRHIDDNSQAKAFYGGLEVCANVWACPVCAAKISERRREELARAIETAKQKGLRVVMLTLTAPHYKSDRLSDLLDSMTAAQTKLWKDKSGKRLIDLLECVGRIRAFEVTYGDNGFHPHFHILLFIKNHSLAASDIGRMVYPLWLHACRSKGLGEPSIKHGVRVDDTNEGVSRYVSKWGIDSEMTKGHVKRSKKGYSMTDLLRAYLNTGDKDWSDLWLVYAKAFKGKRQLVWSKGLKDLLLIYEQTDEELATAQIEDAQLFAEFTVEEWRAIYRTNSEHYVLRCVENTPQQFRVLVDSLVLLEKRSKPPS